MLDRVKTALASGGVAVGTHCMTSDAAFFEMCGVLGYDFVWIEGEHTDMTGPMTVNAIIATNAGGCAAFVRVPWNDPVLVKPILEAGPDGIIFPMINTPQEAKMAVASCRYPPHGKRSFGPSRSIMYGEMPLDEYLEHVERNLWRIIQIEHIEGVKNLDEILKVEGLTAVMCGAMDLSASVGKLGKIKDPEVVGMMEAIAEKCKKAGIPYGVSTAGDLELVDFWLDRGASLICIGSPYDYFGRLSKQTLEKYKKVKAKQP
ncbi:MAG: aldolase/citrate lyase family protein [Peptococcaceae bacterium]|jgi:2-keto-3-deoxy-L-rhamnonate aldolase RhmA|nr:aldolase/citrate lyase family protein [Peptococcaceae bacterium]MDH7525963.1 aldolase/citrate lyase family protein [Peptococcaceae bacterium]